MCHVRSGSFASILAGPPHVRLGGNLRNAGCPVLPVEGIGLDMIQAPKPEPRIMRYEFTDFEWAASGRSFRTSRAAIFQKVPRPSFPGMQALREFLVVKYPAAASLKESDIADSAFIDELERSGFIDRLYAADGK